LARAFCAKKTKDSSPAKAVIPTISSRPIKAYAAFVRSPHAHARIVSLDTSAALAMEGVETVLTGPELVADGIGNIICGWGVTSKDGSPDEYGRLVRIGD
jgi:CO/xanthine dehydrogenase Mo-binding subunit